MTHHNAGPLYPDRTLLRLLPRVLRARDFHLYLEGGKRLCDLWRSGGRAVLGHKAPRVLGELKNVAERGLFTPLPHPLEKRFIKALGEFFPGRAFRLYMEESSLRGVLGEAGLTGPFCDPAFASQNAAAQDAVVRNSAAQAGGKPVVSLWRPFLGAGPDKGAGKSDTASYNTSYSQSYNQSYYESYGLLIPVLPWPLGPSVLVLKKGMDASFPPGELIPPVLLAPAARSLYDLGAVMKTQTQKNGWARYPKIEKALTNSIWRRKGIYLTIKPETEKENYKELFLCFLNGGFLIPPSPQEPVILPFSMSNGEEAKLAELFGS